MAQTILLLYAITNKKTEIDAGRLDDAQTYPTETRPNNSGRYTLYR